MRLIRLEVIKSSNNESIREIKFNINGLSLIVDETNTNSSGSNIGKTTAVKIIDLCLGANSVSSIYKEKDTGENILVKNFIEKYRVVALLTCEIDKKEYILKRALYSNGKCEINGKVFNSAAQYREKLNQIIFQNLSNKPTFRQLISKFIRLDNSNEDSLLKYLGTYCKGYQYQAIYDYLYGIDTAKSENVDIISLNERIDKDIEAILRKNSVSSLDEFETKIDLMKEEVEEFKNEYSKLTILEEYQTKENRVEVIRSNIQKMENTLSKANLKIQLMKDKIKNERIKLFSVDHRAIEKLYEDTRIALGAVLKEFEDLEKFHNGMVQKRTNMLEKSLEELEYEADCIEHNLNLERKKYEQYFLDYSIELKDKFEEKYSEYTRNKIKLEAFVSDYEYIKKMQEEKNKNLDKKVITILDPDKRKQVENDLNSFFKTLTKEIVGETYAIVLSENEFPVKIIGMNGKPGTGIKKTMITCFDLAHINLIIKRDYHMPIFEIHDKMENISLTELRGIVDEAREFEGQYIFPILSDRIDTIGILETEIVLRLSAEDKFFRV